MCPSQFGGVLVINYLHLIIILFFILCSLYNACVVYYLGGWVHSVCFSSSGTKLAWVGHDSSISVVDAANGSV